MKWSEIPWHPPRKMLGQFAVLCLLLFGGLALWFGVLGERPTLAMVFTGLAALVGVLWLAAPEGLRLFFVGWMVVVFPIGWLVSHLLLAVVFYDLMTPTWLISKVLGRDPLRRRRVTVESYWIPKELPDDMRQYFRQY